MSPYSAFIYNILTMGVIFPWTYLWAPTAFQGSNLVLGILFAFLFELPIALAYVWLATALPRSGGDYVFQSRVFGGGVRVHGRLRVLRRVDPSVGGPVGWLLATLGIAPTFIGLGVTTNVHAFTTIGTWAATVNGIIIISLANAAIALLLLVTGFKNYVRFQYVMWYAILISFGIVLLLFLSTNPAAFHAKINTFAGSVDGVRNFLGQARAGALGSGSGFPPAVLALRHDLGRASRLDEPAVGHLLGRAGRRDQERQRLPQPSVHPGGFVGRHRRASGPHGARDAERDRVEGIITASSGYWSATGKG